MENTPANTSPASTSPVAGTPSTGTPSEFTDDQIAIFVISSIMSQKPSIIKAKKQTDFYQLSYIRPSDKQGFSYKVKLMEGNKVLWGNLDGRWRDNTADEVISYQTEGKKVIITQTFTDGEVLKKEFKKSELASD